jgi:hypothetical protein
MTLGATEKPSPPPSTVSAQYETLRMAALGEALPPEARSGLMLFLRRGMWAWAQALASPKTREEPTRAPSLSSAASCQSSALIHILAAMAMNTLSRRTP